MSRVPEASPPVSFPRGFEDLTDTTRCPACFTPLASTTCGVCGLELTHPAAVALATASTDAAVLLHRRVELIGRIRAETADAAAPAPGPAAPAATPVSLAEPRRHLGVQVILLIVGVSLLAVGAIFFLVYAFITFGLVWRTVIIGVVTVAAFAGASLLHLRKLNATAESISALAVVLFYLDAFAIRANDFFGAAAADELVFWGITLLASSVVFIVWHRLSGLRVPSLAGFAAFAPGLAFLVAGLTEPLETADRVFAGFAGAAIGAIVHVVASRLGPRHEPERVLSLSLGAAGLAGATATVFFLRPESDWAAAIGLAIVAVLAFAHVLVLSRTGPAALGAVVGGIGAVAASLIALSVTARMDDSTLTRIVPVVAAVAVALALEALLRRTTGTARVAALAATWTAAVAGAFVALPSVWTAAFTVAETAALPLNLGVWAVPGNLPLAPRPEPFSAIAALLIVVALTAAVWALTRVLARRHLVVLWAVVAVLVLAAPLTGVLWMAVGGWLLLAAAAVTLLIVGRGRGVNIRVLLGATAAVSLALGYAASWASIDTWWIGSLGAVVILLLARLAVKSVAVCGGLLGAALIVLGIAAGAEAWHLNERFAGGDGRGIEAVHGVLALAVLVLAASALLRGRALGAIDTRVAFWLAAATAAVTALLSWALGDTSVELVAPEPIASSVLAMALVVALLLWAALPRAGAFTVERVVASAAISPAAVWALQAFVRPLQLDQQLLTVLTIGVLCVVHIVAFVIQRPPYTTAIAWVALALAAVTALGALVRDLVDPFEGATLPIAVALLTTGAIQLRRSVASGSWAWLAPGILMLLVPSLVATFTEDTVWRLVALGLASIAVIALGALRRLQAPLILGSVIVLVHAIRTFAPQLRAIYEATEWWVWAVVGGAIILFLGFTIERRIRNLRSVATKVSQLR